MITLVCENCELPFLRKAGYEKFYIKRGRKNRFCSNQCHHKFRGRCRVPVECRECKKAFEKTPSQVRFPQHFCSRRCATVNRNRKRTGSNHPNWIGGTGAYRKRALAHYGRYCMNAACVITNAGIGILEDMLDVHHKDSNRKNGTIENLEVLCVWCHALKTRDVV